MNNIQIYILVSCDPLISNSKHDTRDAGINYIHAATCKPVECSQSKGGQDPVWPQIAPSNRIFKISIAGGGSAMGHDCC